MPPFFFSVFCVIGHFFKLFCLLPAIFQASIGQNTFWCLHFRIGCFCVFGSDSNLKISVCILANPWFFLSSSFSDKNGYLFGNHLVVVIIPFSCKCGVVIITKRRICRLKVRFKGFWFDFSDEKKGRNNFDNRICRKNGPIICEDEITYQF